VNAHYRRYTGNADEIARDLGRARLAMHLELCGLETRLWTEDQAGQIVKSALPKIRQHLADMEAFVREIEDTLVTVEEEQDAAKEVNTYAAA
jgi:hypothetical protein